jgi:uncharacterized protein
MNRRRLLALASLLLVVLVVGLGAFETYVFDQITLVDPSTNVNLANRPDDFRLYGYEDFPDFDTSPFEMPVYESVRLPSRTAGVEVAAWYIPGEADAPGVVVTHGLRGCTCEANMLVPAGMLHRNGFNVLMIDLRNHGQSTVTTGHAAFGSTEYLDVLGAWDWLTREKGVPPERIGLFGGSMGAATSLIALAQEPRVPAAFVDSPFFRFEELLEDNLELKGYPRRLAPGAIWMGYLITRESLYAHTPDEGLWNGGERPLYIVHGTLDDRINLHHQQEYADAVRDSGANATLWLVEGAGHVQSSFLMPGEYEQRLTTFFRAALHE